MSSTDEDLPQRARIDRPSGLALKAYDVLLDRLMSLQFRAGDHISIDKLSREFGISQTPIREALGRLETQRLITKTHLVGYSVAENLSMKEYEDLYEIRRLIEPRAAAKAALSPAPATIAALTAHGARMAALPASRDREAYNHFARGDVEFHSLVATAGGNRFIEDTVASWSLQLHLFRRGYHIPWVLAVQQEHETIFKAIREQHAESAEAAMLAHLDNSYQRHRETFFT